MNRRRNVLNKRGQVHVELHLSTQRPKWERRTGGKFDLTSLAPHGDWMSKQWFPKHDLEVVFTEHVEWSERVGCPIALPGQPEPQKGPRGVCWDESIAGFQGT